MSFAETTVAGKTEQSFLTTEIEPTTEIVKVLLFRKKYILNISSRKSRAFW